MKKTAMYFYLTAAALVSTVLFTGCEAIGDIFKAGIWVGIIIVIAIVAIIAFIAMLFKK